MAKANSRPTRISPKLKDFLSSASVDRIKRGVDNKQRTPSELTEMMMNCPSFPRLKLELTSLPKRRKK